MKKKFGIKFLALVIIVAIIVPIIAIGKDYGAIYDEIFGGESFTIYTNELEGTEITDDKLSSVLYTFVYMYNTNELYEDGHRYYLRPYVLDCNAQNMTCNINVSKDVEVSDYNYNSEIFKTYEDVKININTEVSNYFNGLLDENSNMVIQYDESMFTSEEEKMNYIHNYLGSKNNNNSDGNYVSYGYEDYSKVLIYNINDYNNYNFNNYFKARVVVNDIVFDSTETAYSNDYKRLTEDGTLTIKTNGDFTTELVNEYLNNISYHNSNSSFYFRTDGNVVNNKVYIKMSEQDNNGNTIREEKHLISLVKNDNIENDVFAAVGLDGVIQIAADNPEYDVNEYINNYMMTRYNYTLDINDKVYYYFSYIYPYNNSNKYYIIATKNSEGDILDIQFNEVNFAFVGYSDEYSEEFEEKFASGMTVRSDEQTKDSVDSNLDYKYNVLACNNDISVCDIALYHEDENKIEIHKVNITFDNSVSDLFKELFNLNEDGSIDILTDVDLDANQYLYHYVYDYNTETALNYNKNGDKIQLSMNNWNDNTFERHSVKYNIVDGGATAYYKSRVNMNKDFYPGENDNILNQITWNGQFAYDVRNSEGINTLSCDNNTKKCKVMVLNDKKQLEIHEATANIKEGKSPEFSKAFPSEDITFNAIYKNDETYLYGASMAYFMSKAKDWVYLSEFTKDTAKLVFNDLEIHTFNINYEEANEEYAKEISEAKKALEKVDLGTIREDLEFVNKFYYSNGEFFAAANFNSKTLNDNFRKAVNNNHIGYYVVPEGGGGMPFMDGAAGKLVLFYDGVAYDILDDYVDFTNYNILYVPSDTEKTPEAYVAAAQKRVNDYLGADSGVKISYTGELDKDMKEFFKEDGYETFDIDKNNFDHNEYAITSYDSTMPILIVADSSKMQKPNFAAMDVTENIIVTSETVNYPSNSVVMSDVLKSEDSEYSKILEKAKLDDSHIVDINLYSASIGDITDFTNAEFNVSVPITNKELLDKELIAYYIDDEGNVEKHPVTLDGFMANFNTTHFSTYIIADKTDSKALEQAANGVIKNPNTIDNVFTYVLLTVISGIGIACCYHSFSKKEN